MPRGTALTGANIGTGMALDWNRDALGMIFRFKNRLHSWHPTTHTQPHSLLRESRRSLIVKGRGWTSLILLCHQTECKDWEGRTNEINPRARTCSTLKLMMRLYSSCHIFRP
jgi:hypothetical protein